VNPKYNGELIGPGGKNIRKMKEDFGIENIDLDNDGTISILGSAASTDACAEYIKLRTTEPEVRDVAQSSTELRERTHAHPTPSQHTTTDPRTPD